MDVMNHATVCLSLTLAVFIVWLCATAAASTEVDIRGGREGDPYRFVCIENHELVDDAIWRKDNRENLVPVDFSNPVNLTDGRIVFADTFESLLPGNEGNYSCRSAAGSFGDILEFQSTLNVLTLWLYSAGTLLVKLWVQKSTQNDTYY